jgi:hypothetical protein
MSTRTRHRLSKRSLAALLLAMLVLWSTPRFAGRGLVPCACAGDIVPPSRQAVIVMRALAYDANLKSRAGDTINIAVLHKRGHLGSERMAGTMAKAFGVLEATQVSGLPILVTRFPFTGGEALKKSISVGGIDLIYVCEGLEGELTAIMEITRQMKVLTVGSKEEHVTKGLSLGVLEMEEKCVILLNLPASRQEGGAFAADLLRLARVIR